MNLRLKEMRKMAGLRQAEVAERLGVKVRTYGSWERGEARMSLKHAMACATVLGCSLDEIAGLPSRNLDGLSDPREAELHRCYRSCDRDRQERLLDTARDFAGMSRDVPERDLDETQGVGA